MPENNLDYIPFVNLGIYKTNVNYINFENLIDYLYNLKKILPSSSKSNIGGYQSPDNLYLDSNFFSLINIFNKIHNDITQSQNSKLSSLWFNISSFTNYNDLHTHQNIHSDNKLSGVLYLQTSKNSGNIKFYNPLSLNDSLIIYPKKGDLLIFSQILPHSVEPNLSQEDRISIAFNYE
jgi:hypothetical protein